MSDGVASGLCGLPHHEWPETVCIEPVGRHARCERGEIHAGPLVIRGQEGGGAAWTVPEVGG